MAMFQNIVQLFASTPAATADEAAVDDGPTAESARGGDEQGTATAETERRDAGDQQTSSILGGQVLADAIPLTVFVLDTAREVRCWNRAAEELTGTPREDVIGTREVSVAFYQDGRRAKTLADKVVEAPEDADTVFGVNRSTDVDYTRYEDTSTMLNADKEEVDIWFTATPVYRDGEFVGVVELVQDRSEMVRKRKAVEALVTEVNSTLAAIGAGNLDARVTYTDDGVLEPELLAVVDQTNEMASNLETVVTQVRSRTRQLVSEIEETAMAANDIKSTAVDQHEELGRVVGEMGTLSANMEEVAASAQEVSAAANQALEAAEDGQRSGERAETATTTMTETGERLVDRISTLQSHVDEIVDVVDVIAEVADQTNLLALNANIEAARVGESGAGFEVVADEVKTLAEETRAHTEEIGAQVTEMQARTETTVDAVETSNDQIHEASTQIADALDALEEIAGAVDEAAHGVEELAHANDEQAATVEEVTSLVESVEASAADVQTKVDEVTESTHQQEQTVTELATQVEDLTQS